MLAPSPLRNDNPGTGLKTVSTRRGQYFDIKVTDETNTKAEKEKYIAEAFNAFSGLLGNLHEESYIYVQDVKAAAYGYGGKTQEYRYQHPAT
jgi:4-oxalocrotonate tautomerase